MKQTILTLSFLLTFFSNGVYAQKEYEFLTDQINTFFELNSATIEYEKIFLDIKDIETAKKTVDQYSIQIEKSMSVFSKYKKSNNENIKKVSTYFSKLLSDVLNNNYQLLGKLINTEYKKKELKKECKALVDKNQFASMFFREISLGVINLLAKERPKGASENQQFLNLTKTERNEINTRLEEMLGQTIKQGTKVQSKTPFEYSCRLIYEFVNLEWVFTEEKK